ncbi:MAG: hypothetical protein IIU43_03850, partial [Thermoguttaceae bacterium]|nr:hypothetical protein [Thermoguttaceae bacterium]
GAPMKTDVIAVSGSERDLAATLRQAEKMAVYEELAPKNAIQLRLLTEEMMQMMRSITGAMEGDFWIENEGNDYQLHLSVNTRLTSGKRAQLLATSTSGKNESARGFTGWLRDLFDRSADEDVDQFSSTMIHPNRRAGRMDPQIHGLELRYQFRYHEHGQRVLWHL